MVLCVLFLQWAEYVLFAALLVAVCIIFSIMAHFYTYINPAEIEAKFKQNEELETKEKDAKESKAIEMETEKTSQSQDNEINMTKIWLNYDLTHLVLSSDYIIITGVNLWYLKTCTSVLTDIMSLRNKCV